MMGVIIIILPYQPIASTGMGVTNYMVTVNYQARALQQLEPQNQQHHHTNLLGTVYVYRTEKCAVAVVTNPN
jgi:hypothetical protein